MPGTARQSTILIEDEALRDGLQMESRIFSLEEKLTLFEQLKKAGVDLSEPATIHAVVDQLDDLVTRLEKELASL